MTSQQAELLWLAVLVATAAVYIALDVAVYRACGAPCTLSRCVRRWFECYPSTLIAACVGFGCFLGHCLLYD